MATFLEIVTPAGKIFADDVDIVVVPGSEGELGVLSAHAPLVTALQPGELRYEKDGEDHSIAVGAGILEVTPKTVAVLSDMAVGEDDIDEAAVEAALASAEQALKDAEDGTDPDDMAAMQLAIQKSMAQLNVKRRRKQV